jgi:O-antigen ligase
MMAVFILQLDAYFYLADVYAIKPRTMVLLVFLLLGVSLIYNHGLSSWKVWSVQNAVIFLIFCVFVYIAVQLIGVYSWTSLPGQSILYWYWGYMLLLVLLGLMTGHELKGKHTDLFLLILIAHVVILLIDTVWGDISESSQGARASGTLRNPNNAAFLSVALMAACYRWYRQHPGFKEVLALVLTIAAIGLTGSRGGALSFFVLLFIILFWWVSKVSITQLKMERLLMGGFIVFLVMSITMLAIYEMRYVTRANMAELDNSSFFNINAAQSPSVADVMEPNGREIAMNIALQLIEERPWLGHGTGYVYTQEVGPHNMLLRSLVEVGVIGLLGYLMLPIGLLYVARRRHDWGLAALTLCGFAVGMVAHTVTENRSYLIIIGIMLWMNNSHRTAEQIANNFNIPNKG